MGIDQDNSLQRPGLGAGVMATSLHPFPSRPSSLQPTQGDQLPEIGLGWNEAGLLEEVVAVT